MDSGWNFGEVLRSADEILGDNSSTTPSTKDRPPAISGSNPSDNDQMDDGTAQELSPLATSTTPNEVTSTEPAKALVSPVPDHVPVQALELDTNPATAQDAQSNHDESEADRDENMDDDDSSEGDGDGNDDDDGAQDSGNNAALQQSVNWAPAGIDNMDPNWVNSNDAVAESYDCKICTDTPLDADRVFLECGHVFCADCLNQSFRHALTSRANFPPRCCRNDSINFDIAQYHLEDDAMVLVLQNWEEWSAPDPTYCQTSGCTGGMIFDHFVIDQWAHCKTCDKRTCTECKALESAHESPDKHPNALSDEDAELVKKEGWKQCPKCRKVIERIDGCDHMQCSSCHTQFCYRCGGSLENDMACNCQGQNAWVQEAQADIDGAQNGVHINGDGQDDSEDGEVDNDRDDGGHEVDGDEVDETLAALTPEDFGHVDRSPVAHGAFNNWADLAPPANARGWGAEVENQLPMAQVLPPPSEPQTMTLAFTQMRSREATLAILNDEHWIPAPQSQRNADTGALEWVFTRIEPQNNSNDPHDDATAPE